MGNASDEKLISKMFSENSKALKTIDSAHKVDNQKSFFLPLKLVSVEEKKLERKFVKSIFENNLLLAKTIQPKIRHQERGDWLAVLLFFVLVLVSIINVFYRNRFKQLFNAFLSNRFVGQIVREENIMFKRISIFLSSLFLFITALFIYLILAYFHLDVLYFTGFKLYVLILIALLSFYLIKMLLFKFLGTLVSMEKEMKEYIFTVFLYNHFVGLALIIPVIFIAYVPKFSPILFFGLGFFFFISSFAVRTVRSYTNVSGGGGISIFYLFLYLCTLEILPLVIITKLNSNIL